MASAPHTVPYVQAQAGHEDPTTTLGIHARARDELGASGESDAAVVERTLNAYLLERLLDATQSKSGLSREEADKLAVEEVRASRRERRSAA